MTTPPSKPPRPGRIILLNGASSSGKTTLSLAIQGLLSEPFLHCSSDMLEGGWPSRSKPGGYADWWAEVRPRFFAGFHACVAALAGAGNDLIVEHVIEFAQWRVQLRQLLLPFDVFLVGVHCAVEEIDRRERLRGNRRLGEGREHVEVDRIHDFGSYDLQVNTTGRDAADVAAEVVRAWRARSSSVLHGAVAGEGQTS